MGVGVDVAEEPRVSYKDTMGRYRTESLFLETARSNKFAPVFTLKDYDHRGLPSLKRLYLEIADPTEYQTAIKLLGSFKHWQRLMSCQWMEPHIKEWRVELETALESEHIKHLVEISQNPKNASRVTATKLLLEKPWRKIGTLRGRPSSEEKEGYLRQAAKEETETDQDHQRIFGITSQTRK